MQQAAKEKRQCGLCGFRAGGGRRAGTGGLWVTSDFASCCIPGSGTQVVLDKCVLTDCVSKNR